METRQAIEERRSIRKFKSDKIKEEIIIEAIKYGTMAPSAHNRQPWQFKILTTEEKNNIANILEEKTKSIENHTGPHTAGVIREAPYMLLILMDKEAENRDMDIISIGACIENIILYLTDINIGTLWIGNTNLVAKEIQEHLKLTDEPISCLAIGYKNQEPHARPRKELRDVIIK